MVFVRMRLRVWRVLAVVLLLSQVGQVAAGALCGLQRGRASHCDDGSAQTVGASVTAPMDGMSAGFCKVMGPCGTPSAAVTATVADYRRFAEARLAVAAVLSRPESFHPVPIPPPPQG